MQEKVELAKEKVTQAQQKVGEGAFEEALTLFFEAAALDSKNDVVFCGLMICALNTQHPDMSDRYGNLLQNFATNVEGKKFLPVFEFFHSFLLLIERKESASVFFGTKIAGLTALDLSNVDLESRQRIEQTLDRVRLAYYYLSGSYQSGIEVFEENKTLQQQLGWRELCLVASFYNNQAQELSKQGRLVSTTLDPKSQIALERSIALFEQAYKKNSQAITVAYHVTWAISYAQLQCWDKVFKQMIIIAAKDMYDQSFVMLCNTIFTEQLPLIEEKFIPQLKQNTQPYFAMFHYLYIEKKILIAREKDRYSPSNPPACIQEMTKMMTEISQVYPSFMIYCVKFNLLMLQHKPQQAINEIQRAVDLINFGLDLINTKPDQQNINTVLGIYALYIRALISSHTNEHNITDFTRFSKKEIFHIAYGISFTEKYKHQGTGWLHPFISRECIKQLKEIPEIKEALPLAQKILGLREQRLAVSHDEEAYHSYTDEINTLLNGNGLSDLRNRRAITPFSLFAIIKLASNEKNSTLCRENFIAKQ